MNTANRFGDGWKTSPIDLLPRIVSEMLKSAGHAEGWDGHHDAGDTKLG